MRRTKRLDYRAFHTQKKTINTMDNKSATPSDREEIVNQLEIGISINPSSTKDDNCRLRETRRTTIVVF